ncbi:hypothetical protein BKA70DRAFT_1565193 [Coprinopsis sp. MPI-PUGE-AT-0042]|nr:hypothetical protein BKA70DRAFT_1565193 [Coprinopsis sp. MPI-PUGE-AT-0042]
MATSSISTGREYQGSDNSNGQVPQETTTMVINTNQGNIFAGINNGHVTQTIEEFQVLRNLPIHPDISGHLSDYLPNSRADDEARIFQWITSPHPSELVLCMLGKVGVGKSTFAKHLATRLRQQGRLAAEIYLGFALPDWSAELVVRMAAGQLCGTYPELTRAVSEAIRLDVGPSVSLETRIQTLILEPIRSLHLRGPLVILLDALDQWAPHPLLAKALSCLAAESHLIRFIVLGRPGLEDCFQNISVKLHDLQHVSTSIMGEYFRLHFEQVQWEYGRKPSSQMIDRLVEKANGLFIWSSILCSLLADKLSCPKPHDTLAAILQSKQSIDDSNTLANLYHGAINLRFPKPDHKAKLKVFLGAVLVLQEPLSIQAFASLTSMDAAVVQNIQAELGPLHTGKTQDTQDIVYPASSTFHLSLLEYLLQSLDTPLSSCISNRHFRLPLSPWPGMPQRTVSSPIVFPIQFHISPPEATPHSVILDGFSVQQWKHWAQSYLQVVCPGGVEDLSTEELVLPQAVTTTTHPSTRKSIQSFLGKLLHKPKDKALVTPTHNTHQHLISRVAQSLYQSPATEGTPDAIAVAEVATRLQHQSSDAWLKLGKTYYGAAKINASSHLVENAVHSCRYAADLSGKEGHEARQTLGSCLALRFSRLGVQEDLDESILVKRAVLLLTPLGHPDRALSLNNLAASLDSHHIHTGATETLDEAIVLHREVLSLWPPHYIRAATYYQTARLL